MLFTVLTFSTEGHIENFIATWAAYITFVYFSKNLKIWFSDNNIITLYCFISHWHCSTHRHCVSRNNLKRWYRWNYFNTDSKYILSMYMWPEPSPESPQYEGFTFVRGGGGALRSWRGGFTFKFDKNYNNYQCFLIPFGGAWGFVWGAKPTKDPRSDGTACDWPAGRMRPTGRSLRPPGLGCYTFQGAPVVSAIQPRKSLRWQFEPLSLAKEL